MNISGTIPIGIIERPGEQPIHLRMNQRVTAEILKVAGDQVNLMMQGVRVVGRLLGGEEAALAQQRFAQFIVRGMKDGVLQLQWVMPKGSGEAAPQAPQMTVLTQNLLRLNGLSLNETNLMLGQALLNRGLPLTPDLMAELQQVLNGIGKWGQAEADMAAALKAAGLPLSANTLSLALKNFPSISDAVMQLQSRLSEWMRSPASQELRPLAERVLAQLQSGLVNWSESPAGLVDKLSQAMTLWGKSIEAELASFLQKGENSSQELKDASGLLAMTQLRQALAAKGDNALVGQIDRFLEAIRQVQFLNTAQTGDPTNPPWLVVNLPLSAALSQPQSFRELYPANLKIAYRSGGSGKEIDAHNTRLVLTIDLEGDDYLQADLSMVEKRLGAWLTVPNSEWHQLVEEELPELQENLEKMGFSLQFARCEVRSAATTVDAEETASDWPSTRVDVEA